jgi:hypothetical protein
MPENLHKDILVSLENDIAEDEAIMSNPTATDEAKRFASLDLRMSKRMLRKFPSEPSES